MMIVCAGVLEGLLLCAGVAAAAAENSAASAGLMKSVANCDEIKGGFMNAVEQFRNAVFPYRTYANWVFLIVLVGWTLFLVMSLFRGDSDWSTILLILMSLTLAGMIIMIIRSNNAPSSEGLKTKRDPIMNWLLLFALSAWVILVMVGLFIGEINWSFSLTILACLLAGWFLDLNGNWVSADERLPANPGSPD